MPSENGTPCSLPECSVSKHSSKFIIGEKANLPSCLETFTPKLLEKEAAFCICSQHCFRWQNPWLQRLSVWIAEQFSSACLAEDRIDPAFGEAKGL